MLRLRPKKKKTNFILNLLYIAIKHRVQGVNPFPLSKIKTVNAIQQGNIAIGGNPTLLLFDLTG